MTEPAGGRSTPGPAGPGLDSFRRQLALTREELWVDYIGLTGEVGFDQFADYLAGLTPLARLDHNTIAQALNESFLDRGGNHPVPYIEPDCK